jgi:hypothetical protein
MSEVLAEVDCSKTYAEGQAFQVKYAGLGLFKLSFKILGSVPEALNGTYTSVSKAVLGAESYITMRENHFEHVARKKAAKKKVTIEK